MAKIILPYIYDFKKAARYLPDQLLEQQIADIDLFSAHLYDDNISMTQFPLFKYYKPQAKWVYKYQIELIKEWEYRHRTTHGKLSMYKTMYRRLKNHFFPMHALYGKAKWKPIYLTPHGLFAIEDGIEKYCRSEIDRFPDKTYTRRKPPKGINKWIL